MRVLMLSDLYPPFIGGIEQHVHNLSRGLAQRGHDVCVVTMADGELPATELDDGVRVVRLRSTAQRLGALTAPQGRPHSPPFPDPEIAVALGNIVARERPDIVHAHNWMVHSFVPLKRAGRPHLIVTLHDYGNVCAKRSFMYKTKECSGPGFSKCLRCAADNYGNARGLLITMGNWTMQPWYRRTVDMFLPVSNAVAEGNRLADHGLPFEVLPNFVPDDVADRTDPEDPALSALPSGPFWLYVGTLSRHKGVDVLLRAYEGIPGAPPLVLIGPPWHDSPKRYPDNTVVLHNLRHAAVMAAWRRSALGLMPSVFPDPCPTVALEAMASGVPLIASRIGGLRDIVADGLTGILVQPGDHDELRLAMSRFLQEPRLGKKLGDAGRERAPLFMASTVIERLENIYSATAA